MSPTTPRPRATRRPKIDFESVAETASVVILIVHGQRILYANPATSRTTGYSATELAALELWQLAHPSYQGALKRLGDTPAWNDDIPSRYELKVLTKDGQDRWLDLTISPLKYDGQSALAVTAFDITERDRAERALRATQRELEDRVQLRTTQLAQANEHLNSILSSITEAYAAFDADWRFRVVNAAAERDIFARPASDLIGKVLWEEYPQTVGQEIYRQYQLAVESGQPAHFEALSSIAPGRWFEVHAYPRSDGLEAYFRDITERKRAEAEIANLARFPAENPNPVLRLDGSGEILYANEPGRALLKVWAHTTGDVALTYWRNLAITALADRVRNLVDVTCAQRYYAIYITPIVHAGYVNLYGQDITARKRAEEALVLSNQKLSEVLDSIQDDFYVLDRDWKFVYASRQFTSRIGKEPKDFVGNCIWEMFPKHIGTSLEENFRATMDQREVRRFEVAGKYTDAQYSMACFPSAEGITVWGTDITARKRAERQVFETNQRLQAVMNALPVGVSFSDDATCQHITGNPAVLQQFEVEQDDNLSASAPDSDLPGRQIRYYRDGRLIADTELPLQRAVAQNREIPPLELEVCLPSGRRWFCSASAAPIRDQNGHVTGGVAVTVDITARKQAEEQIRQHARELAEANEDLERFNRAAVGRELRMIELKKEVNELSVQAGQPPRYPLEFEADEVEETHYSV